MIINIVFCKPVRFISAVACVYVYVWCAQVLACCSVGVLLCVGYGGAALS